ncbi:MAG: hypothetical protein AMXMBFR81_08120 [Chthonomonas sp.]
MKTSNLWACLAAGSLSAVSFGQAITIYNPTRSIADQQIMVRPWGSGTISETQEVAYEGTSSIRFFTRNYFQGGSLIFGSPTDLSSQFANKANLLQVIYRTADGSMTFGGGPPRGGIPGGGGPPGGFGGPPGGFGGPPGAGGQLGRGQQGGRGGASQGDAGGGPTGGGFAAAGAATFGMFRVVVTTTDGLKSEAYIPASTSAGRDGWRSVGVPLQAIKGFERTNKIVKEVTFSGDQSATIYLGELRVVSDETPITGEPNRREWNLSLGQEIELWAAGYGGSSALRYTWDFDARDGVTEDAEGQLIKRKFRKDGEYTVTLTISDKYGLKAPFQTTIKVVVNP